MDQPIRLAVLLSGNGTTLQNFLDRIADGRLDAEIAIAISSRADALGLTRARNAGVATSVVDVNSFNRQKNSASKFSLLAGNGHSHLVCLGGFLPLLQLTDDFLGRVIDISPRPYPRFLRPRILWPPCPRSGTRLWCQG